MTKLTATARKKLKKSQFAEPGDRKYPIEDKAHAKNALSRVTQQENKGNISKAAADKIRAKARRVLKKSK
ncbi:MAG: hypothetical protein KIH63_004810 [Candidatus Saccharibacteria bacterium]|nr:hypothetical protein [Candidatus Saccharibacteria bacterium]